MLHTWLFSAVIAFATISATGATAHAQSWLSSTKTTWNATQKNGDKDNYKLFYTSIGNNKKAYVWTSTHSKRIHNLKNYKNTTWYASKTITKGSATYVQIHNASGSVSGLVWRGYLNAFSTKTSKNFSTLSSYENYIQTNRSQVLTKALLKEFPNATLSLSLSKYTTTKFGSFPSTISGFKNITPLSTYRVSNSDFTAVTNAQNNELNTSTGILNLMNYWNYTAGLPVSSRITESEKIWNENGMTATKRDSYGSDWYIGIANYEGDEEPTLILAQATD